MEKLLTTIEESKKLLELGIDPNTADMRWRYNHNIHKHDDIPQVLMVRNWDDPYNKDIPAWSLGALIKVYLMLDNNARITFDNRDDGNDLIASMVYAIEHCLKAKTSS